MNLNELITLEEKNKAIKSGIVATFKIIQGILESNKSDSDKLSDISKLVYSSLKDNYKNDEE